MFDAENLVMNETVSKKRALSKRRKKSSTYRRIVIGNVNGKAVVQSDESLPAYEFKTVPGYEHTLIWVNPATPDLSQEQRFDSYPESVVPGPGGTSLHFVTFPPGSVFADPSFDAEAAQEEALVRLRGLADHFEEEDPGMHKTNTVDYSVVYDGEIWLELDDGETLHLNRGDVVVQKVRSTHFYGLQRSSRMCVSRSRNLFRCSCRITQNRSWARLIAWISWSTLRLSLWSLRRSLA